MRDDILVHIAALKLDYRSCLLVVLLRLIVLLTVLMQAMMAFDRLPFAFRFDGLRDGLM